MSIVCLWSPEWRIGEEAGAEIAPILLEEAPRVVAECRGVVWVDGRGLPAEGLARRLLERLGERGFGGVRAGISSVPIVAEGAARFGGAILNRVGPGEEAAFLATCPLSLVSGDERIRGLLEGSGIRSCGDLATLTAEGVEVRFGGRGVGAWRLARGSDARVLFRPIPPGRAHASLDFVDYTVGDASRLVFTLNALLDRVCGTLRERSHRARSLTLTFTLSGGGTAREVLRTARPTSDRALWVRRIRAVLEGITLPDTISGVALEVDSTEPISALQGDLFDRGFTTAAFVEEAVGRLIDLYRGLFVRQDASLHPLAERRARWVDLTPEEVVRNGDGHSSVSAPSLHLQLLSDPRPIRIRTRSRRDHLLPVRYQEAGRWQELTSAGPDRISGGHEEKRPYAREYYRCVSEAGALLWIYRDAVEDGWYLHGWWD